MPMTRDLIQSPEDHLATLLKSKDEISREISKHEEILKANANVGMHGALIDSEGFPRADIDLYAVRNARVRLIQLTNDYKNLMNEISEALIALHSQQRSLKSDYTDGTDAIPTQYSPKTTVYAVVNAVDPDSPAYIAGLRRGDGIIRFGDLGDGTIQINFSNFLKELASIVQKNENMDIAVTVAREYKSGMPVENIQHLTLKPQKWAGKGLLGCHVIPC